jgi:hypothetical protein
MFWHLRSDVKHVRRIFFVYKHKLFLLAVAAADSRKTTYTKITARGENKIENNRSS